MTPVRPPPELLASILLVHHIHRPALHPSAHPSTCFVIFDAFESELQTPVCYPDISACLSLTTMQYLFKYSFFPDKNLHAMKYANLKRAIG